MNALDVLLEPEVLTLLAFSFSLVIVFRSLMMWTRNRTALENQLAEIETQMAMIAAEIPKKKQRIREREQKLPPLKRQHQKMRDYEKALSDLFLAAEEEAAKEEGKQTIKTKGSIEREAKDD